MAEKTYTLTKQEEKFNWKNYQRKFPTIRFIIVLIEILLIALFIVIRFDCVYLIEGGKLPDGTILFYNYDDSGKVVPFIVDQLTTEGKFALNIFYNLTPSLGTLGHNLIILVAHYIEFINSLFINGTLSSGNALQTEILLIALFSVLLIIFTFSIGGTFAPIIRKKSAEKRANKAKQAFILSLVTQGYQIVNENELTQEPIKEQDIININSQPTINNEVQSKNIQYKESYEDDIIYAPLGSEKETLILSKPLNHTRGIKKIHNDETLNFHSSIKYSPIGMPEPINEEVISQVEIKEEPAPKEIETPIIQEAISPVEIKVEEKEIKMEEESNVQQEELINQKDINSIDEKPEESNIEIVEEEPTIELIKPIQPVKATKKKTTSTRTRKPIRPVDAITDKEDSKLTDYIVKTSDSSQLAMSQEEMSSSTNSPKTKKTSALTRNPTTRKKSTSTTKKSTSQTNKTSSKKTTSTSKKKAN